MKTFIITWVHNYGLGAAIINASSIEKAYKICNESDMIWDNYTIEKLDKKKELLVLGN